MRLWRKLPRLTSVGKRMVVEKQYQTSFCLEIVMTIEKLQPRKTKRPMPAREMVAKFKVSERSVVKW